MEFIISLIGYTGFIMMFFAGLILINKGEA